MLNTGKDGMMVFEPAFLKLTPGDTVVFQPAQKGAHNSASLLLPAGASSWRSAPDAEHRVKLTKEGVYLYICDPHKSMGMVGVLQVGKPGNLTEAQALAKKEQATFVMGKDRFSKALAHIK
ncbi:pseudoazurin [Uliginosibacterium aquaticum]|nr:pseudoazurin [Uliginosibacterium aquaticum]